MFTNLFYKLFSGLTTCRQLCQIISQLEALKQIKLYYTGFSFKLLSTYKRIVADKIRLKVEKAYVYSFFIVGHLMQ